MERSDAGEGGDAASTAAAAAQLDELRKQLAARQELRAQNTAEVVVPLRAQIASGAVKLKADIKKSGAFVKKLKMLTENNAESVMKDIVELNLTRYVSECVAAIAEAPLKPADLGAAVRVASLLHQRYDDFTATMVQTLVATFDASYGADDKSKIVKRRILLRLLSELFLAGVYDDANIVVAIIQRVARREGGAPAKSSSAAARQKSSSGSSSSGASGSSSAQLEVPLLVSFAKAVGVEFLGVRPRKFQVLETQLGTSFAAVMRQVHDLVPQTAQREALACFTDAFDMVCKFYLAQHAALGKLEARNEREEANRGEVSDAHAQELESAKQLFDKLQTSVNALADALDRDVPPLPLARDDDGLNGAGILVWEGDGSARTLRSDCPFDDEDTRAFYEDLPDLLVLVPAVVLGLTEADVVELKKKREANASAPPSATDVDDVDVETEADGGDVEGDSADVEGDTVDDADDESLEDDAGASRSSESKPSEVASTTSSAATATTATTGYHHQHDSFFSSLEDLVNRDRCDKAAVDFCYRNSKANRHRLVKTLFAVPRTHLELLPYYARLVATLQSVFKDDIGGELVDLLVGEFTHHLKKRNQFRLESKIKNIRFLGELVKFKLCPPAVAFRCLKKCFADFQGHNVLVATTFLETCGRFLYCAKHTHVRTETFLAIMMKLKAAKHLDPQAETLVQNAYYMCKPPERVARAAKQYAPLYLFILKCLYDDLTDASVNKVVKTLRKLPWQEPSTTAYVLKATLKVTKGKVLHMRLVCDVIKGLSRYHDELSVLLIDDVLERIRHGLEVNDYREHQHSLGVVKLLGELYNCALVNMNVVLETLYLIIHHSHDLLSLPEYSGSGATSGAVAGLPPLSAAVLSAQDAVKRRFLLVPDMRYDPRVPSDVDGPTDVFRIRLVCALIEACSSPSPSSVAASPAERGLSKPRLGRFMVFFQRYIFAKTEVPLETDFVVVDVFEALAVSLKDHFKRFDSWADADAAVQTILRSDLEDAERRFAKKHAALVAANPMRASFGDAGIDALSRAGDDDDDDDSDSDDSDDDDDDDDDDDETRDDTGGGDDDDDGDDDSSSSDDDDDDDDDDDEEEEDEEEEQLIVHDRVQRTEEDDAFEKAFKSMMQSSADSRKLASRVNVDKMAIPTVVKSTGPPPAAADPTVAAAAVSGIPAATASPFGVNGPQGVVFRMLRRGNKGKVEARQIVVPEESSLAQHSHRQEDAGKKELSELKRLVLQNIEREDFDSGLDVPPVIALAPRASSAAQAPAPPPPPRDLNRTGYGISSEWNNDEFGLRRGRGYRGQK